ncbi:MAG: hypothetical protein KBT88_04240 [Gammaproteobacteria bacterium]|nr:hypothetical protein [Gammaproteobacteria bacterium]MBQ0838973.1 hypothetical protein [Gammaproteobacteria bacterium]
MHFILTLLLTFVLVLAAMWVFLRIGTPVYRLDKNNVITLLELVLAGGATENDWHVFIGIPVRHNALLQDIQQRCSDLGETEYVGVCSATLFTEKGTQALKLILEELKHQDLDE